MCNVRIMGRSIISLQKARFVDVILISAIAIIFKVCNGKNINPKPPANI